MQTSQTASNLRFALPGLAGALLLTLAPPARAQTIALHATLDGAQQVPTTNSTAMGTASVLLDLAANTLTFDITVEGLSSAEVNAHIHGYAPPGQNGGIVFNLPLGFKKTGVWNYPQADEASLLANLAYLNIHTVNFNTGGEIRGQLVRDSGPVVMTATLDGLQEVPPNGSLGMGTAHVSVDTQANTLAFDIAFEGTSSGETLAHIHGPGAPGVPAGIKFSLPLGKHKNGVWNYPQSDEADILAGLMYVNIHTMNFGGGELRGQIVPLSTNPTTYCTAKTTSLGCTPAIGSTGLPSASAGSGFVVTSAPVPGGNVGIFFYGKSGPAASPFQGAFLCVQPPTLRTSGTSSGGTNGMCNGAYSIDVNMLIAGGTDPGLVAGALVNIQTWFRDPPEPISGTGLSNGMMFQIRP